MEVSTFLWIKKCQRSPKSRVPAGPCGANTLFDLEPRPSKRGQAGAALRTVRRPPPRFSSPDDQTSAGISRDRFTCGIPGGKKRLPGSGPSLAALWTKGRENTEARSRKMGGRNRSEGEDESIPVKHSMTWSSACCHTSPPPSPGGYLHPRIFHSFHGDPFHSPHTVTTILFPEA